jgi:5-methylcytosine-specific restriction endonuclease McrA
MARGTTNQNARGNSVDRRRRREWLLSTFGDGTTCPCAACGATLDETTITVDRIVPGAEGGRYVRGNIQPMCAPCNTKRGSDLGHERKRAAA